MQSHGRVVIFLREREGKIEIRIEDNGRGISQEIVKKLGNRGEIMENQRALVRPLPCETYGGLGWKL